MNANDSQKPPHPDHLLDPDALERLAEDVGAASLGALLDAFCAELRRREGPLRTAIELGDLSAISAATHAIKGSALTFGAIALGESASRANALARTGKAEGLAAAALTLDLIDPTLLEVARQAAARPS